MLAELQQGISSTSGCRLLPLGALSSRGGAENPQSLNARPWHPLCQGALLYLFTTQTPEISFAFLYTSTQAPILSLHIKARPPFQQTAAIKSRQETEPTIRERTPTCSQTQPNSKQSGVWLLLYPMLSTETKNE